MVGDLSFFSLMILIFLMTQEVTSFHGSDITASSISEWRAWHKQNTVCSLVNRLPKKNCQWINLMSIHVQHISNTFTTHVQHIFKTLSIHVQHISNMFSTHVQHIFKTLSTYVHHIFKCFEIIIMMFLTPDLLKTYPCHVFMLGNVVNILSFRSVK